MTADCPIAYDHTDDLERCEVCGWAGDRAPAPKAPWADLPKYLWPDHAFPPPAYPVTLCGGDVDTEP